MENSQTNKNSKIVNRESLLHKEGTEKVLKVSTLCQKFESIRLVTTEIPYKAKLKPPPTPTKPKVLMRAETMREPSFVHHRKKLVTNFLQRSDSLVLKSFSENVIYDEVPLDNHSARFESEKFHLDEVIYTNTNSNLKETSSQRSSSSSSSKPVLISPTSEKLQFSYKTSTEQNSKPVKMFWKESVQELLNREGSEHPEPITNVTEHNRESVSSFDSWGDNIYEPVSLSSSATESPRNSITKIERIIQELFENEVIYVETLQKGIDDYVAAFDVLLLPNSLKGQRINIFSNIENIHHFHKTKFLPALLECGYLPEKIAKTFTRFLDDNHFDKYIIYVMNKTKTEKLCKENKHFFRQLQKDRLGINSFLLQPVQRLPRYLLLLTEIVKELIKDLDENNKNAVAACCIAEKRIQGLLNTVNEYCEA